MYLVGKTDGSQVRCDIEDHVFVVYERDVRRDLSNKIEENSTRLRLSEPRVDHCPIIVAKVYTIKTGGFRFLLSQRVE